METTQTPHNPITLTEIEARVLATLMEKARTVPDSYPLSLNTLMLGCNQKSSRDPLMNLTEAEIATALDTLMPLIWCVNPAAAGWRATSTTFSAGWACRSNLPCCWAC